MSTRSLKRRCSRVVLRIPVQIHSVKLSYLDLQECAVRPRTTVALSRGLHCMITVTRIM